MRRKRKRRCGRRSVECRRILKKAAQPAKAAAKAAFGSGRVRRASRAASGTAAVRSFAAADRAEPEPPQVEERFTDYGSAAYILKESGGYVAVFSSNDSRTVLVTDIPVSSLRQADQTLLRTGIAAADREAVLALLEDLGS